MRIYAAKVEHMESVQEELISLLDSNRRDKIHRIKNEAERNRSIYAGLLLRYAFLKEGRTQSEWSQITITTGQYGKPELTGYGEFHYSLSHSGEWVICAVDNRPIGVDIQQMRPYRIQLAKRFYHEKEYEYLCNITDENLRKMNFYQMWAAKESYAKLTGRGIGAGINKYLVEENYEQITDCDEMVTAFMKIYHSIPDYVVSVSSYERTFSQQIGILQRNDLLQQAE